MSNMHPSETVKRLIELAYWEEGMEAEGGTGERMIEAIHAQDFLRRVLDEDYRPDFPEDDRIQATIASIRE
jgi:hypothetical protein